MRKETYVEFKKRQQEEVNNFPIAYAFNDQQLQEALVKLGVKLEDCVTVFNHGDIVRKEDAPKLVAMLRQHTKDLKEALKDEEFAEAAFLYEMDNHEYAINWDGDDDVLACFSLDYKELCEMGLERAYGRARQKHYKHAEEWEMI